MLEQKGNQSLSKVITCVALLIHWGTEYEKAVAILRLHTCYRVILADVAEDMLQREWTEVDLDSPGRSVEQFKKYW